MKARLTITTFAIAGFLLLGETGPLRAADPDHKDHKDHQTHQAGAPGTDKSLSEFRSSLTELRQEITNLKEIISRQYGPKDNDPAMAGMNMGMQGMKSGMQMGMKGMSMGMGKMGGGSKSGMNMSGSDTSSGGMNMGMGKMKGMGMMGGGSMSGMNMSGSDSSSSGMNMGMGMMDMMKKKGMGMGMMKGMNMMGMAPEQTHKSALPGFPGASHLYHIGASDFFLDHADHVKITREQTGKLNRIKEQTALAQATADRKIAEAEQQLWQLTASDQPEATKIEAKIREIEKLGGDRRLELIRAVGQAAKILTHEQHRTLTGQSDTTADHSSH